MTDHEPPYLDPDPLWAEEMCPNCLTPWKCNGPHLSEQTPYALWLARRSEPSRSGAVLLYALAALMLLIVVVYVWWGRG